MSQSELKKEFLKIQSEEEFDQKREMFRGLQMDEDIRRHMDTIFPEAYVPEGESFDSSVHWDPPNFLSINHK